MMRLKSIRWTLLALGSLGLWVGPLASQTRDTTWEGVLAEFATRLAADVDSDGVGGITAGVVKGRDLVWAAGFGWADVERRVPAGVNTIYRVGSISKSFTAVALLELHEGGYLDLDDPVQGVLPELADLMARPPGADPITFRHLASHTAGLVREPELEGATEGPLELWEEKILASIPTTSYYAPPGQSYRYSNIGFGVLGYALSRATGIPFMQLVDAAVLQPLGMRSSGFVVTPGMAERLARGYVRRRDGTIDSEGPYLEHVGRGYKVPNGGIYSTVGDLARFIAGLTGASSAPLLGPESRRLIQISQTPDGDTPYSFGFSLARREGAAQLVGHGGSVAGYTAHMVFDPESGIGVILLRNYGGGQTNLGRAAQDLLWTLLDVENASGASPDHEEQQTGHDSG